MIRFLLLGGRFGPVPWNILVVLGGVFLLAAGLFVLLDPSWFTYPLVGFLETGAFAAAGVALVAVGAYRRRRGPGTP